MVDAAQSATELALENQRIGALQIRVVAICSLIQICDGYDVGSIGWAVPSLTHAWSLPPSAFALALLWSNLGVMAGALSSGPIGDRFGRKPRDVHRMLAWAGQAAALARAELAGELVLRLWEEAKVLLPAG
jgi:MFS transporter, AAHS family, 4-hydroxybenzoate transporter